MGLKLPVSVVRPIVFYMVVSRLSCKDFMNDALYMSFVLNMAPRTIHSVLVEKYGKLDRIAMSTVRHVRHYIRTVVPVSSPLLKDKIIAEVVRSVYPLIDDVPYAFTDVSVNYVKCMVCGKRMVRYLAKGHLIHAHRSLIEEYTDMIVSKVMG